MLSKDVHNRAISLQQLLARTSFGLIARIHASTKEQVADRVILAKKLVERACQITAGNKPLFKRIDFLIWANPDYEESDCGLTVNALKKEFGHKNSIPIIIHEVKEGDLYCHLLNTGIAAQNKAGIKYSFIISPEASSYLNQETVDAILNAAAEGALVIGVAIEELTLSILQGEVANTFAVWNNNVLIQVGGFNLLAWNAPSEKVTTNICAWDTEDGIVYYPRHGVEEVIPLALMTRVYGECIATIFPLGPGIKRYEVPTDPKLFNRHARKMTSKTARKTALLAPFGFDLSYIGAGVIKKYRNQV